MGGFIALEHVELTARHFPLSHGSFAVFGEVFAWRGLVVDAVPLLEGTGGEDAVGPEEVEGQEARAQVWDWGFEEIGGAQADCC